MSDHGPEKLDYDLLEDMGYETSDVDLSAKTVSWVSGGLVAFIVASLFIAWWFFVGIGRVTGFGVDPKETEVVRRELPPEVPLLQSNATVQEDMVALRREENAKLNAAEWNEGGRTAKIPVANAIEIVANRGLPTRTGAGIPGDYDLTIRDREPMSVMDMPKDEALGGQSDEEDGGVVQGEGSSDGGLVLPGTHEGNEEGDGQ